MEIVFFLVFSSFLINVDAIVAHGGYGNHKAAATVNKALDLNVIPNFNPSKAITYFTSRDNFLCNGGFLFTNLLTTSPDCGFKISGSRHKAIHCQGVRLEILETMVLERIIAFIKIRQTDEFKKLQLPKLELAADLFPVSTHLDLFVFENKNKASLAAPKRINIQIVEMVLCKNIFPLLSGRVDYGCAQMTDVDKKMCPEYSGGLIMRGQMIVGVATHPLKVCQPKVYFIQQSTIRKGLAETSTYFKY